MNLEARIEHALAGLARYRTRQPGDNLRKRGKPQVKGPRGGVTEVQSLLFGIRSWTVAKAKAWAKGHGYKAGKAEEAGMGNYIRLRQADPSRFRRMRMVVFAPGIKAIVGIR